MDSPGLSTPLVASGVLYVASILDGTVYALHTRDGSLLWRAHTSNGHAGVSSPLVVNGILYVVGEADGTLYALRTSDGSPLWHVQTGYPSVSLPQAVKGNVYVVGSDPTVPAGRSLPCVRMMAPCSGATG